MELDIARQQTDLTVRGTERLRSPRPEAFIVTVQRRRQIDLFILSRSGYPFLAANGAGFYRRLNYLAEFVFVNVGDPSANC